jgi:hypothetical protein
MHGEYYCIANSTPGRFRESGSKVGFRFVPKKGMETAMDYQLIVNRDPKRWAERYITGAQILELAGSPADWVVNQLVPGSGEDPEIAPNQPVDLDLQAEPHGVKRFQTRKPKTNPGS